MVILSRAESFLSGTTAVEGIPGAEIFLLGDFRSNAKEEVGVGGESLGGVNGDVI